MSDRRETYIRDTRDGVPQGISSIYRKMMIKNPENRPFMNEIIDSDEFFHAVVTIKHRHEGIERLRQRLGPFR